MGRRGQLEELRRVRKLQQVHDLIEQAPANRVFYTIHTVFDLISEHALISGHPPFLFLIFFIFILILIIISSDFREGNTSLLYTGLMATRALTLRVRLLGRILKKDNIQKKKKIIFRPNKIC